jgi:hypothetical protein
MVNTFRQIIFDGVACSLRQASDAAGAVLRRSATAVSTTLARWTTVTIAGMSTGDMTIRRMAKALRYCDIVSLTFLCDSDGLGSAACDPAVS